MLIMKPETIHGFAETGYYFQHTKGRTLSNVLHSHRFYEFLYVVTGSFLQEINGKQSTVSSGNLIFLSVGTSHRIISQQENTDVIALSVLNTEMNKFFSLYGNSSFSEPFHIYRLSSEMRKLLLKLCESILFTQTEEYTLHARAILNQLFIFCLEKSTYKALIPPIFSEALDKMHDPELLREGIPALLRISGYSHSQLCRLTKKYLNMTPNEYVNQIRMNYAYELIVFGDSPYEEICHSLGFESFSYFSKLVKTTFGCTASTLRKGLNDIIKTV